MWITNLINWFKNLTAKKEPVCILESEGDAAFRAARQELEEATLKVTCEMIGVTDDNHLDYIIEMQEEHVSAMGANVSVFEHKELEAMYAEKGRRKTLYLTEGARMSTLSDAELADIINTPEPKRHNPDLVIQTKLALREASKRAAMAYLAGSTKPNN